MDKNKRLNTVFLALIIINLLDFITTLLFCFVLYHLPKRSGRFIVFVAKPPINVLNVFMFPKLEFSLFDNIEILFCSMPNFYIRIFF